MYVCMMYRKSISLLKEMKEMKRMMLLSNLLKSCTILQILLFISLNTIPMKCYITTSPILFRNDHHHHPNQQKQNDVFVKKGNNSKDTSFLFSRKNIFTFHTFNENKNNYNRDFSDPYDDQRILLDDDDDEWDTQNDDMKVTETTTTTNDGDVPDPFQIRKSIHEELLGTKNKASFRNDITESSDLLGGYTIQQLEEYVAANASPKTTTTTIGTPKTTVVVSTLARTTQTTTNGYDNNNINNNMNINNEDDDTSLYMDPDFYLQTRDLLNEDGSINFKKKNTKMTESGTGNSSRMKKNMDNESNVNVVPNEAPLPTYIEEKYQEVLNNMVMESNAVTPESSMNASIQSAKDAKVMESMGKLWCAFQSRSQSFEQLQQQQSQQQQQNQSPTKVTEGGERVGSIIPSSSSSSSSSLSLSLSKSSNNFIYTKAEELHQQVFASENGYLEQSQVFRESLSDDSKVVEAMKIRRSKRYNEKQERILQSLDQQIQEMETLLLTKNNQLATVKVNNQKHGTTTSNNNNNNKIENDTTDDINDDVDDDDNSELGSAYCSSCGCMLASDELDRESNEEEDELPVCRICYSEKLLFETRKENSMNKNNNHGGQQFRGYNNNNNNYNNYNSNGGREGLGMIGNLRPPQQQQQNIAFRSSILRSPNSLGIKLANRNNDQNNQSPPSRPPPQPPNT